VTLKCFYRQFVAIQITGKSFPMQAHQFSEQIRISFMRLSMLKMVQMPETNDNEILLEV